MSSPYRTDIDALREKKATLERELDALRARSSELESLRLREAELANELRAVDARIGAGGATQRRGLPMLDQVRVASPCHARWDEMLGDERVRFCTSCEKNVFNLSAMPREEAERLLAERLGGDLCVRFYQRADGTVLTQDCPVGVTKKRRRLAVLSVASAGAMAVAATQLFAKTMGKPAPMMGEMAAIDAPHVPHVMGTVAPPSAPTVPPVQPTTQTPHVSPPPPAHPPIRMGRPALTGKRR